jgi:hypothetical protein
LRAELPWLQLSGKQALLELPVDFGAHHLEAFAAFVLIASLSIRPITRIRRHIVLLLRWPAFVRGSIVGMPPQLHICQGDIFSPIFLLDVHRPGAVAGTVQESPTGKWKRGEQEPAPQADMNAQYLSSP